MPEHVHAEIADVADAEGEVDLLLLLETEDLLRLEHLVGHFLDGGRIHDLLIDGNCAALDLDVNGRAGGHEDVRGLLVGHQVEELFEDHGLPPVGGIGSDTAQQLVDADLGARLGVHLLDDDGTV